VAEFVATFVEEERHQAITGEQEARRRAGNIRRAGLQRRAGRRGRIGPGDERGDG